MISHEAAFTPPKLRVAHLTPRNRYGRLGLSFLNAAKVHSGFIGRFTLELVREFSNVFDRTRLNEIAKEEFT